MSEPLKENNNPAGQPITSEAIAQKLLRANLTNLLKKLNAGGTLTAAEMAIVKAALPGSGGDGKTGDGWAKNQVELANALGVERKTVQRWLKEPGNPGAQSNGKLNISAWQTWAEQNGKKLGDDLPSQTILRTRQLILQNERLEHGLKVLRREYIAGADVEALGASLGAAIRKVISTLHLIAPSIAGMTVLEAEALLREKEDEIMGQLFVLDEGLADLRREIPGDFADPAE